MYFTRPSNELVNKLTQLSITTVNDYAAPRSSSVYKKFLLVDDALPSLRPHLGSSTNRYPMDCLLLKEVLEGGGGGGGMSLPERGSCTCSAVMEHRLRLVSYVRVPMFICWAKWDIV